MQPIQVDAELNRSKINIYTVALPLMALAAMTGWFATGDYASDDWFNILTLPTLSLWTVLSLVMLRVRPQALPIIERGLYLAFCGLFVLNAFRNLEPSVLIKESIWNSALWQGLVYLYAYTVFEGRAAHGASLIFFAAQIGAGLLALSPEIWQPQRFPQIWQSPLAPYAINDIIQFYASQLGFVLLSRVMANFEERTAQARAQAKAFYELAHTDSLTGLSNRRALMEELRREVERSQRYKHPLSLMLLDLDGFKQINDKLGHEVGDRVLAEVGKNLKATSRSSDQAGRWGGEEFVVLMPETTPEDAQQMAERLRQLLMNIQLRELGAVTASFGVSTLNPSDNPDSLIARADQAMYRAKSAGGNRVRFESEITLA